jgi:hypothetical protein
MSITRRDYIVRMIEQFGQALARIAGMKTAGKHDEALILIGQTADGIFGPLRASLDKVDSASAATLLGSRDKINVYAALAAEKASVHELQSQPAKAGAGYLRALELYLEASRLSPEPDEKTRQAISSLLTRAGAGRLAPRYRSMLDRLSIAPPVDASS